LLLFVLKNKKLSSSNKKGKKKRKLLDFGPGCLFIREKFAWCRKITNIQKTKKENAFRKLMLLNTILQTKIHRKLHST